MRRPGKGSPSLSLFKFLFWKESPSASRFPLQENTLRRPGDLALLVQIHTQSPHGEDGPRASRGGEQGPCLCLWEPPRPQSGSRPCLYCHVAGSHKPRCIKQPPSISSQFVGSKSRVGLTEVSARRP